VVRGHARFRGGLPEWVEELVGPLHKPLQEISGGGWRTLRATGAGEGLPVDTALEKRKFLAESASGTWLVKWAGLGASSKAKLGRGQILARSGWTPDFAGLCHGFVVQHWQAGGNLHQAESERQWLVQQLSQYLSFRASNLPADKPGASLLQLWEMAQFNIGSVLGSDAGEAVQQLLGEPSRHAAAIKPVHTDNRLHRWEWLIAPQGHLVKTDALDHDAAHDLIGCQDISWDLAGAAVEFRLTQDEGLEMSRAVEANTDRSIDPALLQALELCYLGFQIGLWSFAAQSNGGGDADVAREMVRHYSGLAAAFLAPASLAGRAHLP
jgi:hypothetical protein